MQFCQPFPPTGFLNYGQPCGLNPPLFYQINGYPDIIGEGNVVSVRSPDGSTQLLFFPSIPWLQWRSFPQNSYVGNLNNPYLSQPINTLGAWFVRNIFNPIQPTTLPQPDFCNLQYPRASSSDCGLNLLPPVLPLKFHNDNCTSTTDIHYFIPKQFKWCPSPTGCAAVQVSCPVATTATDCDYEVTCTKPCNCTPAQPCNCVVKDKTEEKQNIKCMCLKKKSSSRMSIESTRSTRSRRKGKHRTKSRNKSKKTSHKCECPPSSSDKGVTTYADQRIGCEPDRGQTTQTSSCSLPVITASNIVSRAACNSMCYRAEKWSPERCTSKNAMSQSTVSSGECSVNTDSRTSCCTSGTDQE